eukprot:6194565-Pleurochrysis_carterae.AAC.2
MYVHTIYTTLPQITKAITNMLNPPPGHAQASLRTNLNQDTHTKKQALMRMRTHAPKRASECAEDQAREHIRASTRMHALQRALSLLHRNSPPSPPLLPLSSPFDLPIAKLFPPSPL